ncbi:MAG: hypothetical protein AAF871_03630 [Pseudomonadota bacterium]
MTKTTLSAIRQIHMDAINLAGLLDGIDQMQDEEEFGNAKVCATAIAVRWGEALEQSLAACAEEVEK